MSKSATGLVDVIQLSQLHCKQPIRGELKYATSENFIGRIMTGYSPNAQSVCLLNRTPANLLCQVQDFVITQYGLSLVILDAYRPLRTIQEWAIWVTQPLTAAEEARQAIHYPQLTKPQLIELGYIATGNTISKHCFGATVDLVFAKPDGELLDMGTCFDYFDELSHPTATAAQIGISAYSNRQLLIAAMRQFGFQVHAKEYWHFDHKLVEREEPLDLVITPELSGLGVNL